MPAQKIRDIAVKTGEYTDRSGQTKGRWQNVGSLMKGDDGNEFIILNRWFNPAGIPNPDGRDSVLLSCFQLRDDGPGQQGGGGGYGGPMQQPPQQQDQRQGQPGYGGGAQEPIDDEIPF